MYILLLFLAILPVQAAKTDTAPDTVWDQIMTAQSYRDMRTGADHLENKDYDKAIQAFSKAVLARPREPQAHIMLGAAYYWAGQVQRAEEEFRETLRLDPKSAQGHLLMGIVHAWKGDGQAAYQSFQEAEKLAPDRADIQMNMGSMEESLGMGQEAMAHFRRATLLDPANPLYHFQLGMLYRRLGRDSDGIESLQAALRRYPEFEDAMLELGSLLERQGQQSDAESLYRKAVRLKSRDSVARFRLGRVLLRQGKIEKARDVFRDAFHLTPADAGGGLALSVAFGGKPREVSGMDRPSSGSKPPESSPADGSQDPLDVLGRNLERIPLDQQAQLGIEMAVMPRPRLVQAPSTEAPSSLKKALAAATKPQEPSVVGIKRDYTLKASNAAERKAQIAKILEDLRGVVAKASPDAQVRMGMQLNFTKTMAPGTSRMDAEGAPKASYQPRQVGNDLGLWVVGTGWMQLVEEALPEPGEKPDHPHDPVWWVSDGLAYAALGNARAALAAFDQALELNPKEELALLGRAVAFVEMGREKEAIDAYRRLLDLNSKNRVAKDGLAWLLRGPASK